MDADESNPHLHANILIPAMAGVFVFLFSLWLTLHLTWSWSADLFGFASFGQLDKHTAYLWDGVAAYFAWPGSGRMWGHYWLQLEQNNVVGSFYLHVSIPLLAALLSGLYVGYRLFQHSKPRDLHVRGLQYVSNLKDSTVKARQSSLNEVRKEQWGRVLTARQIKRFIVAAQNKDYSLDNLKKVKKQGFQIHPDIQLSFERESRGMALLGPSGSGKTQFSLDVIEQIIENRHRLLMHDYKGDYTQLLDTGDEEFVLIAPWDRRSVAWDIAADIKTKFDARLLAEFLVEDTRDPMWAKAARQVLTGVITYLIRTQPKQWNFVELRTVLSVSPTTLAHIIKEYNPEALTTIENLKKEDGRTGEGVMITLQSDLSVIYDLADAWPNTQGGFSIRHWLEDDYEGARIVILQGSGRFEGIATGLNSMLITLAVTDMADPAFPEVRQRDFNDDYRVYFWLDELYTLKRIAAIEKLISVCRSKGGVAVLGLQDKAQIVELYGNEKLNIWTAQLGTKFIGSTAPGNTANWIAKEVIGHREVVRPVAHQSVDAETGKQTYQFGHDKRESSILLPSQLSTELYMEEDHFTGLLLCTGWPYVHRLRWNKTHREKVREPVEKALWTMPKEHALTNTVNIDELEKKNRAKKAATENKRTFKNKPEKKQRPPKKAKPKHIVFEEVEAKPAKTRKTRKAEDNEAIRKQKALEKAELLKIEGIRMNKKLSDAQAHYIVGLIAESEFDQLINEVRHTTMDLELE